MIDYHPAYIFFLKWCWLIYGPINVVSVLINVCIEKSRIGTDYETNPLSAEFQNYSFFQLPCEGKFILEFSNTCMLSFSSFMVTLFSSTLLYFAVVCWYIECKRKHFFYNCILVLSFKVGLTNALYFFQIIILLSSLACLCSFFHCTEGVLHKIVNESITSSSIIVVILGIAILILFLSSLSAVAFFVRMRCRESPPPDFDSFANLRKNNFKSNEYIPLDTFECEYDDENYAIVLEGPDHLI